MRAVQGAIKAVRKRQSDEELKLLVRRAVKNVPVPAGLESQILTAIKREISTK